MTIKKSVEKQRKALKWYLRYEKNYIDQKIEMVNKMVKNHDVQGLLSYAIGAFDYIAKTLQGDNLSDIHLEYNNNELDGYIKDKTDKMADYINQVRISLNELKQLDDKYKQDKKMIELNGQALEVGFYLKLLKDYSN